MNYELGRPQKERKRKGARMTPKKLYLHELLYTETVNPGLLDSPLFATSVFLNPVWIHLLVELLVP